MAEMVPLPLHMCLTRGSLDDLTNERFTSLDAAVVKRQAAVRGGTVACGKSLIWRKVVGREKSQFAKSHQNGEKSLGG